MPAYWRSNVYRTDLDEEKFVGFFVDDAAANRWIKRQKEGTFEVRPPAPKSEED